MNIQEHDYKNLVANIRQILRMQGAEHEINPFMQEEMAKDLAEFVVFSASKFIAGQKEHGGNICDRDLEHEMQMELTDMFWYMRAMKWKKNKSHLMEVPV